MFHYLKEYFAEPSVQNTGSFFKISLQYNVIHWGQHGSKHSLQVALLKTIHYIRALIE